MAIHQRLMVCLLAGGQGQRMGKIDKALLPFANKNILDYLIENIDLPTYHWIINANDNKDKLAKTRFNNYHVPIIHDIKQGNHGPLMGIFSALHYNENLTQPYEYVVFIVSDTPLIPKNYIPIMFEKATHHHIDIVVAQSRTLHHPTLSLWHHQLFEDVKIAVLDKNMRKIDDFIAQYPQFICRFDDITLNNQLIDPFFNINTPQDYDYIKRIYSDDGI